MSNIFKSFSVFLVASWILSANSKDAEEITKNHGTVYTKRISPVKIISENTQPVGLLGADVSASIQLHLKNNSVKTTRNHYIIFSDNVLVNSYGRKGCVTSNCLMEVKFDNEPLVTYKVYESDSTSFLRKVYIKDKNFARKMLSAKNVSIKIRFADVIDGVFIFKLSYKNKV